jgi:hypothetical protein
MKPLSGNYPGHIWEAASTVATAPRKQGALFSDNYVVPIADALVNERNGTIEECIVAIMGAGIIQYQEEHLMLSELLRKLKFER